MKLLLLLLPEFITVATDTPYTLAMHSDATKSNESLPSLPNARVRLLKNASNTSKRNVKWLRSPACGTC